MIVVTAACQGCGACLLTCPERAIRPARPAPGAPARLAVLTRWCTGCGECIEVCPADAIRSYDHECAIAGPDRPRNGTSTVLWCGAGGEQRDGRGQCDEW
jgi:electron transport complex protein RnfB